MNTRDILDLISRQRPGWSLDQPFYTSPEIFAADRVWLETEWFLLAHSSELPERGSHIVRELLGESLILARDAENTVRGFYNICRHRGSRICEGDGKRNQLTCPYHAWSYRLDGSLLAAPAMPPDIDKKTLGLNPVSVREIDGLIVGSLKGQSADLDSWCQSSAPGLRYYGISGARIAARRRYPTAANWKLVLENAKECYHCLPAHPEYCSIMRHVDQQARLDATSATRWEEMRERWRKETADTGSPIKEQRFPIGDGHKTQSQDGNPVAPLMGAQTQFDGGIGGIGRPPFIIVMLLNDHAVMVQILPISVQLTDVVITWLVDGSAQQGQVDVDRMVWLWDRTTVEDKKIIEGNSAGINSSAYRPGPYSLLEDGTAAFTSFYLQQLTQRLQGDRRVATDAERNFDAAGLIQGKRAATLA